MNTQQDYIHFNDRTKEHKLAVHDVPYASIKTLVNEMIDDKEYIIECLLCGLNQTTDSSERDDIIESIENVEDRIEYLKQYISNMQGQWL
jgi:hypothetical protein